MRFLLLALVMSTVSLLASSRAALANDAGGYGFVGVSASPAAIGLVPSAGGGLQVGLALEPRLRVGYAVTNGVHLYASLGYSGIAHLGTPGGEGASLQHVGPAPTASSLRAASEVPLSGSLGVSFALVQTARGSANDGTGQLMAGVYLSIGLGYANLPRESDGPNRFAEGFVLMISFDAAAQFRFGGR